jgi:hypothetical protein
MSFATILINPAKHPAVPHTGSKLLRISTSLFLKNTCGLSVYAFNDAWGKKDNEKLIHNDIILHLRKALDNWIDFENNKKKGALKIKCQSFGVEHIFIICIGTITVF